MHVEVLHWPARSIFPGLPVSSRPDPPQLTWACVGDAHHHRLQQDTGGGQVHKWGQCWGTPWLTWLQDTSPAHGCVLSTVGKLVLGKLHAGRCAEGPVACSTWTASKCTHLTAVIAAVCPVQLHAVVVLDPGIVAGNLIACATTVGVVWVEVSNCCHVPPASSQALRSAQCQHECLTLPTGAAHPGRCCCWIMSCLPVGLILPEGTIAT